MLKLSEEAPLVAQDGADTELLAQLIEEVRDLKATVGEFEQHSQGSQPVQPAQPQNIHLDVILPDVQAPEAKEETKRPRRTKKTVKRNDEGDIEEIIEEELQDE